MPHVALAPLLSIHGDRFATYRPASAHLALVVHSGEVHFRDLLVRLLVPVVAEEAVAFVEVHCRPLVEHAGSVEAVVVLGFAGAVAVDVHSTARCMRRPGNTGLAGAVSDCDLAGLVSSTHSYLGVHHIADHFPSLLVAHSGRCPIAHSRPGRSHNRNIVGRAGYRNPGTAAAAVSAAAVLGRSTVAVVARGCCMPSWRRCRRAPPMCLS
jgi:hypothetical protein